MFSFTSPNSDAGGTSRLIPSTGKAEDVQGVKTWTRLLASPSEAAEFKWEEFHTRAEQNRTAILNYSSGTVGGWRFPPPNQNST
jgi:hypothetical protein